MKPKTTTGTYTAAHSGIYCSSCETYSGVPIQPGWWDEHTSPLHALKYWFKRRFKK